MPKRIVNPKLSPEEEEALLKSLRKERELKARVEAQAEAQTVARKLVGVAIEKVPEDATPLVTKDVKHFGTGKDAVNGAVIAITLNAVLLSASSKEEPKEGEKGYKKGGGKGGGGGGGKKNAPPKIGAKLERLPPPTGEKAAEAIIQHKATLAKVTGVMDVKAGQEALLVAFEAWLCNEYNEPVLPEAPQLLKALCGEGLLDNGMLSEYWAKTKSQHVLDAEELLGAQAQCKEADAEHVAATEQLKEGQKEDADAAQQAKWAAAEVQNARTGNQPTGDEIAREKAANVSDTKARADRLKKQKDIELYHKRQVSALNAQVAANKNLSDTSAQMRICGLMHQYGQPFFESLPAAPVAAPVAAPEAKA